MRKSYIKHLQDYAISILKEGNEKKPLWLLSRYNCSEISWLVGLKIIDELGSSSEPFTLKGEVTKSVVKTDIIHDILGYFDSKLRKYIIIDPTIWQFFPKKRSIYIGSFQTIEEAIQNVSIVFGGSWRLSYYIKDIHEDKETNLKIVRTNCNQAPDWDN